MVSAATVVWMMPAVVPAMMVVRIVPAPAQAPAVPTDGAVIVGRMPGVPRIVPSVVVIPVEGIIQAVSAIACQTGRVGEVAVVKAIGIAFFVAFIIDYGFVLRGICGDIERVARETIVLCASLRRGVATVVLVHVAKLAYVVVSIFLCRCRLLCCRCRLLCFLLRGEGVHIVVLCVCAETCQREHH